MALSGPSLGAVVDERAVRQEVLLGHLVDALDEELHDEDEEEDRRDLEEQRQIDAVAVARPEPGHAGRAGDAERRRRAAG